jgi:hypothetical protein
MIDTKISRDIPLPTPRSVMSSPNHISTAAPAVMTMTIVMINGIDWLGIRFSLHPVNSCPGVRASETNAVACSTDSPIVRYRVYCVIFAWPD